MYLIVSVDCIGFDHTLFIILYSAIFAASMSINVQYSVFRCMVVFSELTVGKVNEHISELHDWLAPLKRIGQTFLSDAPTVTELVAQIRQYSDEVADMPKGLVTTLRVLQHIAIAPTTSEVGCECLSLRLVNILEIAP